MELFDELPEIQTDDSDSDDEALLGVADHALLIVDDDLSTRLILSDQFEAMGLRTREADSGEQCLEAVEGDIDIVLLDVNMPGLGGIETCRRMRRLGQTRARVIFISADDELETRLRAYDAGGNDFIVKPIEPEVLECKVRDAQRSLLAFDAVAGEAASAKQAAFVAMSSMGEMGTVLEFMRRSFGCEDEPSLARATLEAVAQYGVTGLVSISLGADAACFAPNGKCTPLERSILDHSRGLQRIFQFSNRLVINYPLATLVISDLPMHEPELVGRLRDHLAVIVEAIDARVAALRLRVEHDRQAQALHDAIQQLAVVVDEVGRQQAQCRERAGEITTELLGNMEAAFVHMGLTEMQETELVELTATATRSIAEIQNDIFQIGDRLSGALDGLRQHL